MRRCMMSSPLTGRGRGNVLGILIWFKRGWIHAVRVVDPVGQELTSSVHVVIGVSRHVVGTVGRQA